MRPLALLTFLTLDGVLQGPSGPEEDPSGGFTQGGWAAPYWEEVMQQVRAEAMAEPYDMLFGRRTYEIFAGSFDGADPSDPMARRMTEATKYVVTRSPGYRARWQNSTVVTGDVPGEIARLKAKDGPLLQVHGSGELIQTLLAHDLVDEFRLWTFPAVLGQGRRLFRDGTVPAGLELAKTGATPGGVAMTIYRRKR